MMKRIATRCYNRRFPVRPSSSSSRFLATRASSDQLMGYNPMAPVSPATNSNTKTGIPTAEDVTTMGGVWAPTSSKRDKLTELGGELEEGQKSLDDAATKEQLLDLYLADGIQTILQLADAETLPDDQKLNDFLDWLQAAHDKLPDQVAMVPWETHLTSVVAKIDNILKGLPKTKHLALVRDFIPLPQEEDSHNFLTQSSDVTPPSHPECLYRYRLLLIRAAAQQLQASWDSLTTVSSADVDRAAVQGKPVEPRASALSSRALHSALVSFATGGCQQRTDALWNLMDRDQDGLLDEVEMGTVCQLCVTPVGSALQQFLEDCIDARPVRQPMDAEEEYAPGFWARRRQTTTERRLRRWMKHAVLYHFENEVEMPHRLRCIYAWAEKAHQENKIDSIHVDTGLGGRKRYVELQPKLSLPEFREVQRMHFTHLDRVGQEMIKSFREDLWVDQGRGRQRAELQKNTLIFLGVVTIIDVGIYFL